MSLLWIVESSFDRDIGSKFLDWILWKVPHSILIILSDNRSITRAIQEPEILLDLLQFLRPINVE